MDFHTLNFWAILVAALSAFLIGGARYSPALFAGAWKEANGFVSEEPKAGPRVFVLAFVLSLVMAANLAMFLNDPKTTTAWGATAGFLAGFGWAAMGIGIVACLRSLVAVRADQRRLSYGRVDDDGGDSGTWR